MLVKRFNSAKGSSELSDCYLSIKISIPQINRNWRERYLENMENDQKNFTDFKLKLFHWNCPVWNDISHMNYQIFFLDTIKRRFDNLKNIFFYKYMSIIFETCIHYMNYFKSNYRSINFRKLVFQNIPSP